MWDIQKFFFFFEKFFFQVEIIQEDWNTLFKQCNFQNILKY